MFWVSNYCSPIFSRIQIRLKVNSCSSCRFAPYSVSQLSHYHCVRIIDFGKSLRAPYQIHNFNKRIDVCYFALQFSNDGCSSSEIPFTPPSQIFSALLSLIDFSNHKKGALGSHVPISLPWRKWPEYHVSCTLCTKLCYSLSRPSV